MSIVAFTNQRLWNIQQDINEGLIDLNEILLDQVNVLTWLVLFMGVVFGVWLLILSLKVFSLKK